MALNPAERLVPSMLDRLMDPESGGTRLQAGYGLEQIVASVRRDLENLINTRRGVITVPEEFAELQISPIAYGLPDFGSIATATKAQQEAIGRRIEDAIAKFEPRLTDVAVRMIDVPTATGGLTLKFDIQSRLNTDPFPDVSFHTVLELTTGYASIQAGLSDT